MRFILMAVVACGLLTVGYFAALNISREPAAIHGASRDTASLSVYVEQRGELFARRGDVEITYSDVGGFMSAQIPPPDRGGFLRSADRIAGMIDNLLARHAIAGRALAEGLLEQHDGLEAEILHKAVNSLFEAYVEDYVGERMLDSYEDQAREAYLLDPDRYRGPETVTFRHLLIIPKASGGETQAMERILEVDRRIAEQPENFDAIISEHSQDPLLEQNDGYYEDIDPEMLEPGITSVLREMEPGAISDPIRTRHGWHIVQLDGWSQPESPEYEDVRQRYIEAARAEHRAELHRGLVDQMLIEDLYLPEGAIARLLERYGADVDLGNTDVETAERR